MGSGYHEIGRQFVCLDHRPDFSAIVAVLIGGSNIYSAGDGRDERHVSDWDGAIIVSTKLAILRLVNERRQNLMDMLARRVSRTQNTRPVVSALGSIRCRQICRF